MTEVEIILEFQRRRRLALTRGWPVFLLGFVAFGAGGKYLRYGVTPAVADWAIVGLVGGMTLMLFGIMAITGMRCPACGALPMVWMNGSKGLDMNPRQCTKCGAPLGG